MSQLKWKHCAEVEQEHEEDLRQYAHTYHYANTICLARAFWLLPKPHRDGILLHEVGHLIVGPEGSEREATEAAEDLFGVEIRCVDSPHGKSLERLMNSPPERIDKYEIAARVELERLDGFSGVLSAAMQKKVFGANIFGRKNIRIDASGQGKVSGWFRVGFGQDISTFEFSFQEIADLVNRDERARF